MMAFISDSRDRLKEGQRLRVEQNRWKAKDLMVYLTKGWGDNERLYLNPLIPVYKRGVQNMIHWPYAAQYLNMAHEI